MKQVVNSVNELRTQGKRFLSQITILVVEDDPIAQKITMRLLSKIGFHFEVVSTGKAAISSDLSKYQMIFLNIFLPDIKGFDVAKSIRVAELSNGLSRKIPIIAYTACGSEIKEKCIEAGFDDFLFKPAGLNELNRVISRFIPNNNNLR